MQSEVVVGAVGSGNRQLCGTVCSGLRCESRNKVVGPPCLAVASVSACSMLLCYVSCRQLVSLIPFLLLMCGHPWPARMKHQCRTCACVL